MSNHLPECDFPADPRCICDRLRAARADGYAAGRRDGYDQGTATGVKAARDAVEALLPERVNTSVGIGYNDCCNDALAAIDGIGEQA